MPITLHKELEPAGELGLWRIQESEEWFRRRLDLAAAERKQLDEIKGRRRRVEWLAVRQLVHEMSGREQRGAFVKDAFGKPHMEGADWHISISHSHDLAAAIAAPVSVGVDIQYLVPKIERLVPRYMRPEERASVRKEARLPHLHVYWGAKEALYKAYGRRQLDFRTHILIQPFTFDLDVGKATGRVQKGAFTATFQIFYSQFDAYILVYAIES